MTPDKPTKVTPLYASPAPQGGERELTFVHALAADFENSVHHVWDNQEVADRIRQFSSDLIAAFPLPAATGWQPIETAPKDGTSILLLSKEHTHPADMNGGPYHHPPKCAIGRWHAEGTSWCDENGRFPDDPEVDDDSINLHVTGVWFSGGGWFQPNEVTHWQPLPAPPALTDKRPSLKQEDK